MRCVWLLAAIALGQVLKADGYKILVYNNLAGHSHVSFMSNFADVLTEAGHDVTVLFSVLDHRDNKTALKLTKKTIYVPQAEVIFAKFGNHEDEMKNMWTQKMTPFLLLSMVKMFVEGFTAQCKQVLTDDILLDRLRAEKFDIGVGEPFCLCPFFLFEAIQLPVYVTALSAVSSDHVAKSIGRPVTTSYVPGLTSTSGPEMSLGERIANTIHHVMGNYIFSKVAEAQQEMVQELFPNMPHWPDLIAQSTYVFTNSHPLMDFPSPTLDKVIPIGGINVQRTAQKTQLSEEWNKILNERKTTVLVSFGSNMHSEHMPDEYKQAMLKTFESMPDTTFIWKYEQEGATLADHLPNVHLSTWMPQNALLADPRLTAFVTHGGLASTMELAFLSKPAVMVPMFADQQRNALMLSRFGGAVVLVKDDLADSQKMAGAIRKVIDDESYLENAKKLAAMLAKYPRDPKKIAVSHVEFAAEFGKQPFMDPYGRKLGYIQYFLVDAIAAVAAVVGVVVVVLALVVRCVVRRCCCSRKAKVE